MTTWAEIELDDELVDEMVRLGLAQRVIAVRTTPLFDKLALEAIEALEAGGGEEE